MKRALIFSIVFGASLLQAQAVDYQYRQIEGRGTVLLSNALDNEEAQRMAEIAALCDGIWAMADISGYSVLSMQPSPYFDIVRIEARDDAVLGPFDMDYHILIIDNRVVNQEFILTIQGENTLYIQDYELIMPENEELRPGYLDLVCSLIENAFQEAEIEYSIDLQQTGTGDEAVLNATAIIQAPDTTLTRYRAEWQ